MRRAFAVIIAVIALAGLLRSAGAAAMPAHAHTMGCQGVSCAADPMPSVPSDDCVEHCLQAARHVATNPTVPALLAGTAVIVLSLFSARLLARSFRDTGGPSFLGQGLRLETLAGVVMLN